MLGSSVREWASGGRGAGLFAWRSRRAQAYSKEIKREGGTGGKLYGEGTHGTPCLQAGAVACDGVITGSRGCLALLQVNLEPLRQWVCIFHSKAGFYKSIQAGQIRPVTPIVRKIRMAGFFDQMELVGIKGIAIHGSPVSKPLLGVMDGFELIFHAVKQRNCLLLFADAI